MRACFLYSVRRVELSPTVIVLVRLELKSFTLVLVLLLRRRLLGASPGARTATFTCSLFLEVKTEVVAGLSLAPYTPLQSPPWTQLAAPRSC
jgi:hypothetical protein